MLLQHQDTDHVAETFSPHYNNETHAKERHINRDIKDKE